MIVQCLNKHFPQWENIEISPINKGGSDRKYYRCFTQVGDSIIVSESRQSCRESERYIKIARFLETYNISAPKIYFYEPQYGLIGMQDLGAQDLWSINSCSWNIREPFYKATLELIVKLHALNPSIIKSHNIELEPQFDEQLYLWEQSYFFEHCLYNYLKIKDADLCKLRLQDIAVQLASMPRCLIHRDFQSQNILINSNMPWLIDFQGMRQGLLQYDIASLLYDPYVQLSNKERSILLNYYKDLAIEHGVNITSDFKEIYYLSALQRIMQALGAYGFLGLQKQRTIFLQYIPYALQLLCEVTEQVRGLEDINKIIALHKR